jgi:hypothetical protein
LTVEEKIKSLRESTERLRRDCERLHELLNHISNKKYPNTLEGYENRMFDIDHSLSDLLAIDSYLSVVSMKLFSGEYNKELFEAVGVSKQDFSSQVFSLREFYRSMSFLLTERSRTSRSVWESKNKQEQLTVTKE